MINAVVVVIVVALRLIAIFPCVLYANECVVLFILSGKWAQGISKQQKNRRFLMRFFLSSNKIYTKFFYIVFRKKCTWKFSYFPWNHWMSVLKWHDTIIIVYRNSQWRRKKKLKWTNRFTLHTDRQTQDMETWGLFLIYRFNSLLWKQQTARCECECVYDERWFLSK